MRILVTGGAGYIGSHTVLALLEAGYAVLIADNYSNSKPEALRRIRKLSGQDVPFALCDLRDEAATDALFAAYPDIEAVIHFAGLKAVGESVNKPLEYYDNNLKSTLNLLNAMRKYGVHAFVFSSSATVYGDPVSLPIREDAPLHVASPYGRTKLMIEEMLRDVAHADPALRVSLLRYFNPVGAHPSGLIGEDPNGVPNNLMPFIAQVAIGKLAYLPVYGDDYDTPDGTGVRDYIHVCDLAQGHVAALKALNAPGVYTFNLGTGHGYSVLDIVRAYERACGHPIAYSVKPRRAGDIASCYADPAQARDALHWEATHDLSKMCEDSWNFQRNNPDGYRDE